MVRTERLPWLIYGAIFAVLANFVANSANSRVVQFLVMLVVWGVFLYLLWRFVIVRFFGWLLSPLLGSSKSN